MPLTNEQKNKLQQAANGSYVLIKELGLPIDFVRLQMAQWAVESGWGAKHSGKNNFFGMTWVRGDKRPFSWVSTFEELTFTQFKLFAPEEAATATEFSGAALVSPWSSTKKIRMRRRFVDFPTMMDSFRAHLNLLLKRSPYAVAIEKYKKSGNIEEFVNNIGPIYATDRSYAKTIISIMNHREVKEVVAIAIGSTNKEDSV